MDIAKSLSFITEDERYIEKLAFGVGVLVISSAASFVLGVGVIGFFILSGYCLRLLKNVRDGVEKPLPEWDQWGADLARGFKLWVAQIVWAIPAILFTVPGVIGGIIADSARSDGGEMFGAALITCTACLVFLYSLFVLFITPGSTIAFAKNEKISEALQVTKIWQWTRQNLGQIAVSVVVLIAAGFVIGLAGLLGVIACGIGLIVTIPLAGVVTALFQYHLYGQLAHEFPMEPISSESAVQ